MHNKLEFSENQSKVVTERSTLSAVTLYNGISIEKLSKQEKRLSTLRSSLLDAPDGMQRTMLALV